LIDTNVVSELRRPRPNQKVRGFVGAQSGDALFTTEVTFAEIRFGIEQLSDPARRSDIAQWLDRSIRPLFAGRVLSVTEDVLLRWRLMREDGRRRGHTFSEPDLLIAAMAARADLIVVSRDTSEFVAAHVPVFDPWDWALHAEDKVMKVSDADSSDALPKVAALLAISASYPARK
jgi:hypothetical protein